MDHLSYFVTDEQRHHRKERLVAGQSIVRSAKRDETSVSERDRGEGEMANVEAAKTNDGQLVRIRVGGVPEHFNEPWQIALEERWFEEEGLDVQWHSVREGTGAMINQLKGKEIDVIVALTEGLINEISNGSNVRLLGTYVQSPLLWSVSTGMTSTFNSIEDLRGETFGISRYNSGSHLMTCVLANQYGWQQSDVTFLVKDHFDKLRKSVDEKETSAFLWESFMQRPFYQRREIRSIGEILTPWPCFLLASTSEFVDEHLQAIEKIFVVLRRACRSFRDNGKESIQRIVNKFHLTELDAGQWFDRVNILADKAIAESTIETTLDALINAQIMGAENKNLSAESFLDTRIAKLTVDIKSMRLYNKPELLIALRNHLRVAGLSKGSLSYEDLLPYDQNHYFGTEVLDVAVRMLRLNDKALNGSRSPWIIQIGSNLAGCARYLSGRYNLKVLAIELQTDLSQAASELTERCALSDRVHHIAGDYLIVSEHLQSNVYHSIVSWITILHLNEKQRQRCFDQSHRLLIDGGFFYLEDFVRIGQLTSEESHILEHDVFCSYLPSIDQYRSQLLQSHFEIIHQEDLSLAWKTFTNDRSTRFIDHQRQLIDIHGKEIYERLQSFYRSIAILFQRGNVGGIRILARKRTDA